MKYIIEDAPATAKQPSALDYAKKGGQFVGGLLTSAAEGVPGLLGLPGTIQELTVGQLPGLLNILSDINQKAVIPAQKAIRKGGEAIFGDIEPENIASRTLQGVARGVGPTLATGGGSALLQGAKGLVPGVVSGARAGLATGGAKEALKQAGKAFVKNPLGRDIGVAGAMAGAEEAGAGPVAGLAAGLGASYGLNRAAGLKPAFSKTPKQETIDVASKYKNDLYKVIKDEGGLVKHPKTGLKKSVDQLKQEVEKLHTGHSFPQADKTSIEKNLDLVLGKLKPGKKLSVEDLYNMKKEINSVSNYENSKLGSLQKRSFRLINDEIESLAKTSPRLHNAIRTADKLHAAESFENNLSRYLNDSKTTLIDTIPNENAQFGLLGVASATGGFKKQAIKLLGKKVLGKASEKYDINQRARQMFDIISKDPKASNALEQVVEATNKYNEVRSSQWKQILKQALTKYNNTIGQEQSSQSTGKYIIE